MNYSATSYRASCFTHYCLTTRNASLSLTQCPQALGLDSSYPTGDIFLGSLLCGVIYPQIFLLYIDCCVLVSAHSKTTIAFHRAKTQILHFQMTRSAAMTYLAGRKPFVYFDQMFSSMSIKFFYNLSGLSSRIQVTENSRPKFLENIFPTRKDKKS